uniref:Uncharacterized protein n=1 Tax=Solanum lycopersicum TaxID=4081 RepID=A0A3Q7HQG1_SOLLC
MESKDFKLENTDLSDVAIESSKKGSQRPCQFCREHENLSSTDNPVLVSKFPPSPQHPEFGSPTYRLDLEQR